MTKKKRIIVTSIVLIFVAILLIMLRFLWKIYPSYYFCDNAETAGLGIVEITDDHILFSENIFNLGHFFDGYRYHIEGNTMYIGIKTMFLVGSTFNSSAEFSIPISGTIEKIVLCGRGKERMIYDAASAVE